MAIRFQGIRYTKDVDFATSQKCNNIDKDRFIVNLNDELTLSSELLPYNLDCRVQTYSINPPGGNKNFQTLKIRMAYAYKGSAEHRRLMNKQCPTILEIDYSFNEINNNIDTVELEDGSKIKVYSISDFVGEKFRAIIQQKTRNRSRRQDTFDIYWLLKKQDLSNDDIKMAILESLIKKSESRGLKVNKYSLSDDEIIKRSKENYSTLSIEIEGELPPFEKLYETIKQYYESLPW